MNVYERDEYLTEFAKQRGFTYCPHERGPTHSTGRLIKHTEEGVLTIWNTADGWQTAVLDDNHYQRHKNYPSLKEAIKRKDWS